MKIKIKYFFAGIFIMGFFVLISLSNHWITEQQQAFVPPTQKNPTQQTQPVPTVTQKSMAKLPAINPLNDPLAPRVKKKNPVNVQESAQIPNKNPAETYELPSDTDIMVQ